MMPAAENPATSMMQKGWVLSAPAVYMVYSFALSQFLQAPFHSAAKTPPALFHRSYRCYIYVTPLGSGLPQCVWRSRIADRYNAPRSVSRVRSGFRDDCVWGSVARKYRNVFCPSALRSLKTLRSLSLGKNLRYCVWRILPMHFVVLLIFFLSLSP